MMCLFINTRCRRVKKKKDVAFIDQDEVNRKYSEVFMRVSYKL